MHARIWLLLVAIASLGLLTGAPVRGQRPGGPVQAAAGPASDARDAGARDQRPLVIENVTVIDTVRGDLARDRTVVVDAGHIQSIAPAAEVVPPEGAIAVDGRGRFLIPGLWDMHLHMYIQQDDTEVFLALLLAGGVTGCRDMHSSDWPAMVALRDRVARGEVLGPRLVVGTILDGRSRWPGSLVVTNADDAREAARLLKQGGVDFLKVYDNLSREAYLAIVEAAGKLGMPVDGHVPIALSGPEDAATAGQRCIEHATRIAGNPGSQLLRALTEHGTWVCPTLTLARRNDYVGAARLKALPSTWRRAHDRQVNEARFQRRLEAAGALHKAGIPLLAGTDSFSLFHVVPGFSLHDELQCLVQAGLSPLAALQTATLNPAKFLGRLEDHGTVEPGKLADLVLLEANPLDDIGHTERIAAVVVAGRLLTKEDLRQMLNGLP